VGAIGGGTRLVVTERNLRGYRGLTFDAFGSLLQGGPGRPPAVLGRLAPARGSLPSVEEVWRRALRTRYLADPFVSFREAHRQAFDEVFAHLGISDDVDRCIDEAFDEYRLATAYPEVRDVIKELEAHVVMAVVSNMDTALLLEALHRNGLAFTFVIASEEEQRYKPSASIFQRAVRYLGLPAANILHVGDSVEEDLAGAASVGMGSVLIRRPDRPAGSPAGSSRVVRDLREVLDVVRQSWN
jgi:2-haloalkanoic acid dehalogenase type II